MCTVDVNLNEKMQVCESAGGFTKVQKVRMRESMVVNQKKSLSVSNSKASLRLGISSRLCVIIPGKVAGFLIEK